MRRAEAWASGEEVGGPAPAIQPPGVFVGPSDGPDIGPDLGPDLVPDLVPDLGTDSGADSRDDLGADIDGEPRTVYHDLDDDGWETLKPFLPFFRV